MVDTKYKENSLKILEKRWKVADNKAQFDENSANFCYLKVYKWVSFVFFISKIKFLAKRWKVADNKAQFDENSANFHYLKIYKWVFFVFFISKNQKTPKITSLFFSLL